MFLSFSFGRRPIGRAWNLKYNWPRAGDTETRMKNLLLFSDRINRFRTGLAALEFTGDP
jgi:hypothetical protein